MPKLNEVFHSEALHAPGASHQPSPGRRAVVGFPLQLVTRRRGGEVALGKADRERGTTDVGRWRPKVLLLVGVVGVEILLVRPIRPDVGRVRVRRRGRRVPRDGRGGGGLQ